MRAIALHSQRPAVLPHQASSVPPASGGWQGRGMAILQMQGNPVFRLVKAGPVGRVADQGLASLAKPRAQERRPEYSQLSWTRGAGPAGNRAWRSSSLFSAHPGPPDSPPAPGQFGRRPRDSASHISSMVLLEESSVRTSQTSGARRGSWPQMPGHPMESVFSGLFGARSARAGAALENRLSLKKAVRVHHSSPTSRNCEYRFFPPTC